MRNILFVAIAAVLGFAAGAALPVVAQTNIMRYTEKPYSLELFVYRKGKNVSQGRVDFPTRWHVIKTSESMLSKSATKEELESFCSWVIEEEK